MLRRPERSTLLLYEVPGDETPKEVDALPAVMLDCGYRSSIQGSFVAVDVLVPVMPQSSGNRLRPNLHDYRPVIVPRSPRQRARCITPASGRSMSTAEVS